MSFPWTLICAFHLPVCVCQDTPRYRLEDGVVLHRFPSPFLHACGCSVCLFLRFSATRVFSMAQRSSPTAARSASMLVSVTLVFPFATWLCLGVPPPHASFLPIFAFVRSRSLPRRISSCFSPFARRLVLLCLRRVAVGPRRPTPRLVSTRDTHPLSLSLWFFRCWGRDEREGDAAEGGTGKGGGQPHPLPEREHGLTGEERRPTWTGPTRDDPC